MVKRPGIQRVRFCGRYSGFQYLPYGFVVGIVVEISHNDDLGAGADPEQAVCCVFQSLCRCQAVRFGRFCPAGTGRKMHDKYVQNVGV